MITYDLIDRQLKDYYVKGHKVVSIVGAIISMALAIFSLFYDAAKVFLIITAIIEVVFLTTWNINKRKYGSKLLFSNDEIIIINFNGEKIKQFNLILLKASYTSVAFDEYPRHNYRKCLVLYDNTQPYENMEYSSFWDNVGMVIIQNPSLIEIVSEKIRGVHIDVYG